MHTSPPHPGVHFPPPLVYLAGIGLGWMVHRRVPVHFGFLPSHVREGLAAVGFAIWLVLMLSAFVMFWRKRTTVEPAKPARALITGGVYRFTRNPLYVSFVALYLSLTLVLNTVWPLLFLPLVILVIEEYVIAREERYLTSRFPDEYPAYCRRVGRWL